MRKHLRGLPWLCLGCVFAIFFTGCNSSSPENSQADNSPVSISTAESQTSPDDLLSTDAQATDAALSTDSAEPVTRRGNPWRAKLLSDAMKGLRYENETVTVHQREAEPLTRGLTIADAPAAFQEADNLLNRNRVIESIKSFSLAVLLDKENSEYLAGLGHAFIIKGKYEPAMAALQTALDADDNNTYARFKLADLLNRQANFEEAIHELNRVLLDDPEYPGANNKLAIWSYYAGDMETARKHVDIARTLGQAVPSQLVKLLAGEDITRPQNSGVQSRSGAGQIVIGSEVRCDNGNNQAGNETTAASTKGFPNEVITGWNDYRNQIRCGIGISTDFGQTFQDIILRPPLANQATVEGDPMTCFDDRTGQMWAGAISFAGNGGLYVARKEPGDTTFQPTVMADADSGVDKCWMAAGVDPFNSAATRLYIAYNFGVVYSTDEGDSWNGPTGLSEFGIGLLPRIGPGGELYIAYWDFDDGIKLIRSFDGGQTLSAPIQIAQRMDVWGIDGTRFPGNFRVAALVPLAVDQNTGDLYAAYIDTTNQSGSNRNVDIYFSKSTNQGATWSSPVIINNDNTPPGDQFFPWLEVDDRGRIHMIFYDTRQTPGNDNASPAIIEAYYSYSDDGGSSWTETVLTNQPFSSADDGFGDGFIGDYLGLGLGGGGCYAYPCYLSTHEGVSNVYVRQITDQLTYPADSFERRSGRLVAGDVADTQTSNNQRLEFQSYKPSGTLTRNSFAIVPPSVGLEFTAAAPNDDPCELRLRLEAQVSDTGLTQSVRLFDFVQNAFVEVDSRNATTSDSVAEIVLRDNPARFIDPSGGDIRVLVRWKNEAGQAPARWTVGVDHLLWTDLTTNR